MDRWFLKPISMPLCINKLAVIVRLPIRPFSLYHLPVCVPLRRIARLTKRLPIRFIPRVAAYQRGDDVVSYLRSYRAPVAFALRTKGMGLPIGEALTSPPCRLVTLPPVGLPVLEWSRVSRLHLPPVQSFA